MCFYRLIGFLLTVRLNLSESVSRILVCREHGFLVGEVRSFISQVIQKRCFFKPLSAVCSID